MKRVIYSFYVDVPEEELDFFDVNILKKGHAPMNIFTKYQFSHTRVYVVALYRK